MEWGVPEVEGGGCVSLQAQGASSPTPSCFVRTESCLSWWVLSFSSAAKGRMGAGAPTSRRWSGDEDVETSEYHFWLQHPRMGTPAAQPRVGSESASQRRASLSL